MHPLQYLGRRYEGLNTDFCQFGETFVNRHIIKTLQFTAIRVDLFGFSVVFQLAQSPASATMHT
ncbi:hypothetical protein CSC82_00845 [Rhodobacteraceae bacterium 4F10]|nr:hypothetical protein CSC82_00845 [Rhodobacteraceae bacterium 4F10]